MVSICTVLYAGCDVFIEALFESIAMHCKNVSEVIIAHIDAKNYYDRVWTKGNIQFKQFGHPLLDIWKDKTWNCLANGHALGMHACLERANSEYVMFCDPDVFFYHPVETLYLDLINEYDIDYIGISHHAAMTQAFTWFPCITNSMVKKRSLPTNTFLKGKIKLINALHINNLETVENQTAEPMDGYWLLQGPIEGLYDKFPNKNLSKDYGLFDVGCNLWLWSLEKNWRWLAFQTTDCHLYNTAYNRGNIRIDKIKNRKLLYHLISGSRGDAEQESTAKEAFFQKFEEMKND
jgi:predicted small integral membrane protein